LIFAMRSRHGGWPSSELSQIDREGLPSPEDGLSEDQSSVDSLGSSDSGLPSSGLLFLALGEVEPDGVK
jgi:hypothetical protein